MKTIRCLGILLIAGVLASCAGMREMTLARKGGARAVIVVAADATPAERHAAEELSSFLKQVTGAEFPVAGEAQGRRPCLRVGEGAARAAIPGFSAAALGPEEIVIKSVGRDLALAGGRPRGTLYAVYTFLEDQAGCHWWSSRASTIPHKPALSIPRLDVRYNPPLEYRDAFYYDAFDADWSVRNKNNGLSTRLDENRGGKVTFAMMVHTFYPLIPPETYFAAHPEWFSMIGGKRTHERAQLCLTNEALRDELVKNLKEVLRKNPQARFIGVSQNDWHGRCECPACAAVEAEEGSPSGPVIRFVNAVAKAIEPEFPNVSVITLAYQYTRKAPLKVRPRRNVVVQLCSIECSFREPLEAEANKDFRDDIIAWSKLTNRLYIWDYVTKFPNYFYPFPNFRVLGPNVRFFIDHGAIGIFEEGAYGTRGAEMAELRAWVLAKLLWNPKLDENALIRQFLEGYYGPAAPAIQAWLDLTHNAAARAAGPMRCGGKVLMDCFTLKEVMGGQQIFNAAQRSVAGDKELTLRVRTARLGLLELMIVHWKELQAEAKARGITWPFTATVEEVQAEFLKDAREAGVTRHAEYGEPAWFTQAAK